MTEPTYPQIGRMRSAFRCFLIVSACLFTGIPYAGAQDATSNGVEIRNTASGTFVDRSDGTTVNITSNESRVAVLDSLQLRLESPQTLELGPLDIAVLPHRVINEGNVDDRYDLTLTQRSDDDFDLADTRLIADSNDNGVLDAGDQDVTQTPVLTPGDSFVFFAVGTVPFGVNLADRSEINLTATSSNDPTESATNTDVLTVNGSLPIQLNKQSSQSCDIPVAAGDSLSYTLSLNAGEALENRGRTISIDGAVQRALIFEDEVPANTTLTSALFLDGPANTQLVFALPGDPVDSYRLYNNWDGVTPPRAVGLAIPDTNGNQLNGIILQMEVRLNENLTTGTLISNTGVLLLGRIGDAEVSGRLSISTETVCNTTAAGGGASAEDNQAVIRFLQPSADLRETGAAPEAERDEDYEDSDVYVTDSSPNYDLERDGLYLDVTSTSLNTSSFAADDEFNGEAITVLVEDLVTGDSVVVTVPENGQNTGIFRSPLPIRLTETESANGAQCSTANPGGCFLRSSSDSTLRASIFDPGLGRIITDAAVVDPLGVVFDSATDLPVAGVTVSIRNLDGSLALDPDTNGTTVLAPQVTGSDGRYAYPRVFPGSYYLSIDALPPGYTGPSIVPASSLSPARFINESSYGRDGFLRVADSGVFVLSAGDPPLFVDIPVDPVTSLGGLVLEKSTSVVEAGPGDLVPYQLTLTNQTGSTLDDVSLRDALPFGVSIVSETIARDDGSPITARFISGDTGEFDLGQLANGQSVTLGYTTRFGAGSLRGNGINTASASGRTTSNQIISSNEALATVRLRRNGLLGDGTILFGRVMAADADLAREHGLHACHPEGQYTAVPDIRLTLEDGTSVVSDPFGNYSIAGLSPQLHVLRIDPQSLPAGVVPIQTDSRQNGDARSRFVDLHPGEMHRADFVLACRRPDVFTTSNACPDPGLRLQDVNGYRGLLGSVDAGNNRNAGTSRGEDGDLSRSLSVTTTSQGNVRVETWRGAVPTYCLPQLLHNEPESLLNAATSMLSYPVRDAQSSGDRGAKRPIVGYVRPEAAAIPEGLRRDNNSTPSLASAPGDLEQLTRSLRRTDISGTGQWIWPDRNISVDGRFIAALPAGLEPVLMINDVPVDSSRLGEVITNPAQQLQLLSWYGAQLRHGENVVKIVATDPFGNQRVLLEKTVLSPGAPMRMTLDLAQQGSSALQHQLIVRLEDLNGLPARGIHIVTLETVQGQWQSEDLQPDVPGFQVRLDQGPAILGITAHEQTETLKISGSADGLHGSVEVPIIETPRELFAVGLVTLTGRFGSNDLGIVQPSDETDLFADELSFESRAAFFLKGKVKGDALLTVAYDSRKDSDDALFRDIDPDQFYPVYGDSAEHSYDAQSRSPLYVRIEKDAASLMWGDFRSDPDDITSLGRSQQVLTGANARAEFASTGTTISAFAALREDTRITEDIPGNGTALNYRLANTPLVTNSETIEIITRDRDNPGLVISRRVLSRFGDYRLDPLTGILALREAVPTFDADGHPVTIRAAYDRDDGNRDTVIAGVRIRQDIGNSVTIDGRYTHDSDDDTGGDLASLGVTVQPSDTQSLSLEAAQVLNADGTDGQAVRASWEAQFSEALSADIQAGWSSEHFDNPDAPVASGREEARATISYRPANGLNAKGEAFHSFASASAFLRQGLKASLGGTYEGWDLEAIARLTREDNATRDDIFPSLGFKAARDFRLGTIDASASVEYEQDVSDLSRQRVTLEGDVKPVAGVRVYGRHELVNDLASRTGEAGVQDFESGLTRGTTLIGVEAALTDRATTYGEYRVSGLDDGRSAATAYGLRADIPLRPGLRLTPQAEWINTLSGDDSADALALSVALTDTGSPHAKTTVRLEGRLGQQSDFFGASATSTAILNEDWTSFIRGRMRFDVNDTQPDRLEADGTIGVARRPLNNNFWHMLGLYQLKYADNVSAGTEEITQILATHHNIQPTDDLIVSGRLAGKWQSSTTGGFTSSAIVTMADLRIIQEILPWLDLDIHGGILTTDLGDSVSWSAGAGANIALVENLRIGAGFNFVGFTDEDLDAQGLNAQGLYAHLDWKFDERLFNWLR